MHTGKEETTTIFVFFSDKKKDKGNIFCENSLKKEEVINIFMFYCYQKKTIVWELIMTYILGKKITDNKMIPYAFHKSTYTIHANLYDSDLLYLFLRCDTFPSFKFNEIKLN